MNKSIVPACFLCVTLTAISAQADVPAATAEELFQEARSLVDGGRYAEACPKLEQSHKLEPAVGTQFNLADCYEHVGRAASAYLLFGQVASIARAAGKFERERSARARAAALEPRLPRLRLVVTSSASGLEVRVDDALVDKAAWTAAFPIDPGPHRVRASAPGRTSWETPMTANEGRVAEVAIPELIDPSPSVVAPAPPSAQRTGALVGGGVGTAALAVGAVAGAIALSDRSTAERTCPSDIYRFRCPTEEGAAAWNRARTSGNVSTIAFVAGGVTVAGAAVLWFTAPTARTRVGTALGGLRLEGTF